MYLKWLIDNKGERVSEQEAIKAFLGKVGERVMEERGWTFHAIAGLPTLREAVELMLCQHIWERHLQLGRLSESYGSEGNNPWHHFYLKDGCTIFLNMDTGEEREMDLTKEQKAELSFANKLMKDMPFLASLFGKKE